MEARPLAVITGGSSGIGLALARRLAHAPLAARAGGPRRRAPRGGGDGAAGRDQHPRLRRRRSRRGARRWRPSCSSSGRGRIDLLVCNAGVPGRSGALDVDPAVAAPDDGHQLPRHGRPDPGAVAGPGDRASGRVVNVCSVAGTVALARSAPYAASKHAALAWSRALGAAAPAEGVRVLTVNPGPVATAGLPADEAARASDRAALRRHRRRVRRRHHPRPREPPPRDLRAAVLAPRRHRAGDRAGDGRAARAPARASARQEPDDLAHAGHRRHGQLARLVGAAGERLAHRRRIGFFASASGRFEQRRVRVVAFAFAVAVFAFAVIRTAMLPAMKAYVILAPK